jgi:ADP-ribosylglycohydrolase
MFLDPAIIRHQLRAVIADKQGMGYATDGLNAELDALPASYDALHAFAERLSRLPLRAGWPHHEPSDWEGIRAAWDADGLEPVAVRDAGPRVAAAFVASCVGCILGKPLEVNPTLDEIRAAAEAVGEWPLNDYISEALVARLGRRHPDTPRCLRGSIDHVALDDDLGFAVLGMLVLEAKGAAFTTADVADAWFMRLAPGWTWGPENTVLSRIAAWKRWGQGRGLPHDLAGWAGLCNPGEERCGAVIRVDAYGYACPGDPRRAAELAWRDAILTHRGNGLYGAMFVAAAIAAAFIPGDPLDAFRAAARVLPRTSRLRAAVDQQIRLVAAAPDWLSAYRAVHGAFKDFTHCLVLQELGTLMVSQRFAGDVGEGLAMQVAQGNDTDSFGHLAGCLLGVRFGPGHLSEHWTRPFRDRFRCSLVGFDEDSLAAVASRMSRLPGLPR